MSNQSVLERLVRHLVATEAMSDAEITQGREVWWGALVDAIIDALDADKERTLSLIADYITDDEGS